LVHEHDARSAAVPENGDDVLEAVVNGGAVQAVGNPVQRDASDAEDHARCDDADTADPRVGFVSNQLERPRIHLVHNIRNRP
jgi:hypothetical protein